MRTLVRSNNKSFGVLPGSRGTALSPEDDVDALVRVANGPKEQRSYDAGHELNDAAPAERDAWLVKLLLG